MLSSNDLSLDSQKEMNQFLSSFRQEVNPDLMFVHVNLSGSSTEISRTDRKCHENDVFISGYSDQLLRYRGDTDRYMNLRLRILQIRD